MHIPNYKRADSSEYAAVFGKIKHSLCYLISLFVYIVSCVVVFCKRSSGINEFCEKRCTFGMTCARRFERGLYPQCVVRQLFSFESATRLQTGREGVYVWRCHGFPENPSYAAHCNDRSVSPYAQVNKTEH